MQRGIVVERLEDELQGIYRSVKGLVHFAAVEGSARNVWIVG